jgi:hypothetical protein
LPLLTISISNFIVIYPTRAEDRNPVMYESRGISPIADIWASFINKKSNTEPPSIEGIDNKNENLIN